MIYRFVRWLLFLLPAELAHQVGMAALQALGRWPGLCRWLRARALRPVTGTAGSGSTPSAVDLSVELAGVRFPNPIGLAAGLDKNAVAVEGLFALGFGAVEVGTLTPQPQPGNPKPRIFRIPEEQALINRLGFNNRGASAAAVRLARLKERPGPVGVNIGKNKSTPLAEATQDYIRCVDALAPVADYLVVNLSSPNTPGLRQLQEPETLAQLFSAVRQRVRDVAPRVPVFLKIAPDLSPEAVDTVVEVAAFAGADGLIATNTTVQRPVSDPRGEQEGGLSGRPLKPLADEVLRRAYRAAQERLPIIGVGGVMTAKDAYDKIRAGASVVQIYTGFIYGGPGMLRPMLQELEELLRKDGFAKVGDAVGADEKAAVAGVTPIPLGPPPTARGSS